MKVMNGEDEWRMILNNLHFFDFVMTLRYLHFVIPHLSKQANLLFRLSDENCAIGDLPH